MSLGVVAELESHGICSAPSLFPAPPDDGYADTDDGDSHPAISVDAFTEESFGSKSSRSIAERADRHDETHFLKGQDGEKREESQTHQGYSKPHPPQAQRLQNESQDRPGAEVVDFSDALHGPTPTQLSCRSRYDDQEQERNFKHGQVL